MNRLGRIELTPEEGELFGQMIYGVSSDTHEALQASCAAAVPLARSLLNRSAVPEIRLRYFNDPELNIGSKKSRAQIFESNGTKGDAILGHGHFLKYLRYFILGPDLPPAVIKEFSERVLSMGFISSGDIDELEKLARAAIRKHQLGAHLASEEFFKLSLECGAGVTHARLIRDAARRVR